MSLRQTRLSDEIRDIIAVFFLGDRLNDPRLQGVTITAVDMSPDLQIAKIYFRLFDEDDESKNDALTGMKSASSLFRKELGKKLDLRRVPELKFFYDESLERAGKIETILQKIHAGDGESD